MEPSEQANPENTHDGARALCAEYLSLQYAAQQHGRHLDNIVLSTLGTIVLLATGGVLVVESATALEFGQLGSYSVYLSLFFGLVTGSSALVQRAQLVPNPAGREDPECGTEEQSCVARLCLDNAATENHHRKSSLMIAWFATVLAVLSFIVWVAAESPDDGLVPDRVLFVLIHLMAVATAAVLSITYIVRRTLSQSHTELEALLDKGLVLDLEGRKFSRKRT